MLKIKDRSTNGHLVKDAMIAIADIAGCRYLTLGGFNMIMGVVIGGLEV